MTTWKLSGRTLAALLGFSWLAVGLLIAFGADGLPERQLPALLVLLPTGICLYGAWRGSSAGPSPAVQLLVGMPALVLLVGLGALLGTPALEQRALNSLASAETLYAALLGLALSSLYVGLLLDGTRRAIGLSAGSIAAGLLAAALVSFLAPATIAAPPAGCRAFDPVPAAAFDISARAEMDGEQLAHARLEGSRGRDAEQWRATRSGRLAPDAAAELVRVGEQAWLRHDGGQWQPARLPPGPASNTLDAPLADFLRETDLAAAEDLGVELVGQQPGRRCRLMLEGTSAGRIVPLLGWLLDEPLPAARTNLPIWRGELDWWIGADERLLRAELYIGGHPRDAWGMFGLQGRLRAELLVRALAAPPDIQRPVP